MNNYFYEIVNFLPEEVVLPLISSSISKEKEEMTKSIHDKGFIMDLLTSRIEHIPTWLSESLCDNNILITDEVRAEKDGWLFVKPFNIDNSDIIQSLQCYFEIDCETEYDKVTLMLMKVTIDLMDYYLKKHKLIPDKKHLVWYAEMSTIIDLFNDSLEHKYSSVYVEQLEYSADMFEESSEILRVLRLKLKTGDL